MEDVVLHYQPGSAAGLSCLLERTERLLESFPCRTPPVFRPWFSSDRHLPIRPARPAPVITGPAGLNQLREAEVHGLLVVSESPHRLQPPENPPEPEEAACVSEPPKHLLPRTEVSGHKDGSSVTDSPLKRSWSVFTQRGGLRSESMSRRFRHVVSVHRLHLHQRAKWVIGQHNCGGGRDIEQVWCSLSRCVWSSGPPPPPCNANIRRERLEIWVFCDVVLSEQVGRYLKEELQLSGGIDLSVLGRGNVFSM